MSKFSKLTFNDKPSYEDFKEIYYKKLNKYIYNKIQETLKELDFAQLLDDCDIVLKKYNTKEVDDVYINFMDSSFKEHLSYILYKLKNDL